MRRVLIVFESRYGQSLKVARFVAMVATERGLTADVRHASTVRYDQIVHSSAVVVVAPTYFGRPLRTIATFLSDNVHALADVPSAFVAVGNAAASRDAGVRANAAKLANAFASRHGLHPRAVITVGGALAYPRYGFVVRTIAQLVARKWGIPVDASRAHELTDWASLEPVLDDFLAAVGVPVPSAVAREVDDFDAGEHSAVRPRVLVRPAAAYAH